jgi:hypothetical protein
MTPHGRSTALWRHATNVELVPGKKDGLMFMLEA